MDNFVVSARKYRPDNFHSVVGQSSITSTLKNAIKSQQLGHAYLFSGPRGVGKTTCARIFAKTINCMNLSESIEACNECESCKAFAENRAYNIHELDAASNNSVDDIRTLTEQVRIPPQVGKYSLYIIDEVHMLSASAFNAFLKTLEEPPSHAIFILATTEKHKIIPTILSRCQIYDFNRIKTNDSVDYLKYIAKEEGVEYEVDAFHVIAQKAEGAMRDALSIFDQVVSFSDGKITYASVIENLNILDVDHYFKLTEAFMENDVSSVLLTFNSILDQGFDARNFISGLASHLRDVMVSKNKETIGLLDLGDRIKERYLKSAETIPIDFIYEALEICNQADLQFRNSKNQRLTIELALVKLANLTKVQKKKLAEAKAIKTSPVKEQSKSAQSENTTTAAVKVSETGPATSSATPPAPLKTSSGQNNIDEKQKEQNKHSSKDLGKQAKDQNDKIENGRESQVVHTKSISIKGVLSGEKRVLPLIDEEIGEADQVTAKQVEQAEPLVLNTDDIRKAWDAYADTLKDIKSKQRVFSTLKQHKPKLNADGVIVLELNSNAQRDNFVQNIKPGLVKYFEENLGRIEYVFETTVLSNGTTTKKVYTDEDKILYLAEKNPSFEKMRIKFKLDIDN